MAIVLILAILITLFWLKSYTNHGQQLELPDYVGIKYDSAKKDADEKSFALIIKDSIHRVGVRGGEILDQTPVAYSKVKENRTVYVTVAKYNADLIRLEDMPVLYGAIYEDKKTELGYLSIETEIKDYRYDTGEPDHILEVWQGDKQIIGKNIKGKGVTVPKGGKLSFVLSKSRGGMLDIPDLTCKMVSEADFLLISQNLKIGKVTPEGIIENEGQAYITSQYPPFSFGSKIEMGSEIDITIVSTKPKNCSR